LTAGSASCVLSYRRFVLVRSAMRLKLRRPGKDFDVI
jgi:hypothetical protein